ncbi:MAG: M20/M25/M40 family metallo-hydrolase, partial [Tenericutes bacterium]|nr:M20/M25/M40 family metallo-hydrolase [Mycoplasmatota bacterium]
KMKGLTNNLAIIDYDGFDLKLGLNIRYPRNYDFLAGETKMAEAGKPFGIEYKKIENSKPHYVSPDDKLIKSLLGAYQKYSGDTETPIFTIGGGTYARRLTKAVAFGALFPGEEELAHQPNEYLNVKNMVKAIAIYAESIELLAGE